MATGNQYKIYYYWIVDCETNKRIEQIKFNEPLVLQNMKQVNEFRNKLENEIGFICKFDNDKNCNVGLCIDFLFKEV